MTLKRSLSPSLRSRIASLLTLAIVAGALPVLGQAASFPCEKARSQAEKAVCSDPQLSELDEHLGRYYAAARATLAAGAPCLVEDQRRWLRQVRDACTTPECLKSAYLARLSSLDALQPGATALRAIELPPAPTLVAALPPAADTVAAPRQPSPKPLTVSGQLVDETSTGDGFVLVSAGGQKHVVASLMFLDASTSALGALARGAAQTYQVRGVAEQPGTTPPAFAQGHCRLVYRLPR